jgi:D-alanyl-D-alanine carboxypeptidase
LGWFRSSLDSRVELLTVRQLATHTAGLAREGGVRFQHDGYWPSKDELHQAVDTAVVAEPGVRLLYSNYGISVLGDLVASLSGKPHYEYLRDEIFVPLGMESTFCEPDPSTFDELATGYLREDRNGVRPIAPLEKLDAFAAACGSVSTAADMSRYLQFWIEGNEDVLSSQLRNETARTQWYQPDGSVRWGIGTQHWTVGGRDILGHSGLLLGFCPRFGVDLERRRAVVVLANALDAPTIRILEASFRALEKAKNERFGSGAIDRKRAQRFCGEFSNAWAEGMVTCLGDSLIGLYLDDDDVIDQPNTLEIENNAELKVVDGSFASHVGQTVLYDFDRNDQPKSIHYGSYRADWFWPF